MPWRLPSPRKLILFLAALVGACLLTTLLHTDERPSPVGLSLARDLDSAGGSLEGIGILSGKEAGVGEALKASTGTALEDSTKVRKEKIAFVVVVTKDGPVLDGAGVLREGIRRSCRSDYGSTTDGSAKYEYEYIAITNEREVSSKMEDGLRRLGWKVDRRDLPVAHEDMEDETYREMVEKAGCCGAAEFLKLYAFVLHEYKRVVVLDMDSFVMGCLDALFEDEATLLFTYDMGMCPKCGNELNKRVPPYQGGFFVIQPSQEHYDSLTGLVRQGDFRESKSKKKGIAWAGTGIGWYWGGRTIQGIFPYYFTVHHPGKSRELDPCVYNNMVDNDACQKIDASAVRNCHFTVCQKPWNCAAGKWRYDSEHLLCKELHDEWYRIRAESAIRLELVPYEDLQSWAGTRTPRDLACENGGRYVTLLSMAR